MITDVTGVLLAGGKSRRMGEDKRFILVGQETLFDRSLTVLRELFEAVCVVIAQDSPPLQADVPVVRDLIPDCGSLGGLYTGLRLAKTQHIFVVACDMPFLTPHVIRHMVQLKDSADIVISRWATRLQPTHAVYGRKCLPVIEEMMTLHNRKRLGTSTMRGVPCSTSIRHPIWNRLDQCVILVRGLGRSV
jgi:molybdenum cofactor guanylyltransferase